MDHETWLSFGAIAFFVIALLAALYVGILIERWRWKAFVRRRFGASFFNWLS